MRYVFDIETDGFLDVVSKVHCIVLKDIDTNEVLLLSVDEAVKKLSKAKLLIGHNIIKYDIPVLKKLFVNFVHFKAEIFDTLVATRLLYPDVKEKDFQRKDFPRDCIGRHSLKAWGNRIGTYKAQFDTDWKEYTPEMRDYCVQDVEVTHSLYNMIETKGYSKAAMQLEHDVASLIYKQETYGFTFNVEDAQKLYSKLNERRIEIEDELQKLFPPEIVKTPFIPKVNNKARGYIKGEVFYKENTVVFNPSSRHHIGNKLITKYSWKPTEYTDDGKPKLDETILAALPYPEAKILCEHFLLDKRIAQLATGAQAWLKHEKNWRIHGTCNTNSTVTARATHSYPNMAQVPSVGVPFGKECRALFTVPAGKKLVGVDVSGLEVRMLAHYMARYDNGDYAKIVLDGDIHTETQTLAGLDSRDLAKRFYYCFLYGGGVNKIASVTNKTVAAASKIKKRFLNGLPALNKLITDVQKVAEKGYLIGLDKRKIRVRSSHAALNTLLQSGGAIVCKQWLVEFNKAIQAYTDVHQVVWVHDEIQIECPEKDADTIGKLAVESIQRTGELFNLRLPLTGEYKIGNNWSETH